MKRTQYVGSLVGVDGAKVGVLVGAVLGEAVVGDAVGALVHSPVPAFGSMLPLHPHRRSAGAHAVVW